MLNVTTDILDRFYYDVDRGNTKHEIIRPITQGKEWILKRYDNAYITNDELMLHYDHLKQHPPKGMQIVLPLPRKSNTIDFPYIKGMTAMNLFFDLRAIHYHYDNDVKAWNTARELLQILNDNYKSYNKELTLHPYPKSIIYEFQQKCGGITSLLMDVIRYKTTKPLEIDNELGKICEKLHNEAKVPFRDNMPHNVIIGIPKLYFGRFDSYCLNDKMRLINEMLSENELDIETIQKSIYHIDFKTLRYLSTSWASWFALNWNYATRWIHDKMGTGKPEKNSEGELLYYLSSFERSLRHGCRMLAFRLLHWNRYFISYRRESESYYLQNAISSLGELYRIGFVNGKELSKAISAFIEMSNFQPSIDYYEEYFRPENRQYYNDVFPF
jgi:hypothetical protein